MIAEGFPLVYFIKKTLASLEWYWRVAIPVCYRRSRTGDDAFQSRWRDSTKEFP